MEKRRKANTTDSTDTKKTATKAKKTTTRGKDKEAGLKPRFFSKAKREIHDIDYADQLTDPKVRKWMNNFMEEWVGARLNHEGKKFHKSRKSRKVVYDANNRRNRDMFNKYERVFTTDKCAATEILDLIPSENPEDALIDYLDSKKESTD